MEYLLNMKLAGIELPAGRVGQQPLYELSLHGDAAPARLRIMVGRYFGQVLFQVDDRSQHMSAAFELTGTDVIMNATTVAKQLLHVVFWPLGRLRPLAWSGSGKLFASVVHGFSF